MDVPRFGHDCTSCVFLGPFERYDLWWHVDRDDPKLSFLIARHSSDGADYISSFPPGAFAHEIRQPPWYVEILKRAHARHVHLERHSWLRDRGRQALEHLH